MEVDCDARDGDVALRIIVTDDDPLARRLIGDTLQRVGMTVVAEAASGREGIELALLHRPDIVVMDYTLPGIDGIEATRRLHADDPSIRVVMLIEVHDDDVGLRALRAGAAGFLSKEIDLNALPRALRATRDGEAAISRRFAMTVLEQYRALSIGREGLRPVWSRLTAREWEVLDLLTAGMTADQIADALVLSGETIRTHIKHVYRKLEVHSRDAAIHEASRLRGLTPPVAECVGATPSVDDIAEQRFTIAAPSETPAIMLGCPRPRLCLRPRTSRIVIGKRRNRSGRIPSVMTGRGRAIPTL